MTEQGHKDKKYVFVMCHSDLWGAFNANKLVKAVVDLNQNPESPFEYEPILIISRSTPSKDNPELPAVGKVTKLLKSRCRKENGLLHFFEAIDDLYDNHPEDISDPAKLLTFNQLAKKYCADGVVHTLSCGGQNSIPEVQATFDALEKQGITPEIVLSGDTLAFLPGEITERYNCFGTHPGPLPEVEKMHATARSISNGILYDEKGERLPLGSYRPGGPPVWVKGSVFKLAATLDKGPVLEEVYSKIMPGKESLVEIRANLYDAMTSKMIEILPDLLNPEKRAEMVAQAQIKHDEKLKQPHDKARPLTNEDLDNLESPPEFRFTEDEETFTETTPMFAPSSAQQIYDPAGEGDLTDVEKFWMNQIGKGLLGTTILSESYLQNSMKRFMPNLKDFDETYFYFRSAYLESCDESHQTMAFPS